MISVAFKMLMGDRAKYLGIIFGVSLATMLIVHQVTIFTGLMARTWSVVQDLRDSSGADLIVAHPSTEFLNDVRPMADTELDRVRGVQGVSWATPMIFQPIRVSAPGGRYRACWVVGLDDATLLGGPAKMAQGSIDDLRTSDGVIIDRIDAYKLLSRTDAAGKNVPLAVGDEIEVNDHRAKVVGLSANVRPFLSQPIIYTTYTRAAQWSPRERRQLGYVLVKVAPGVDHAQAAAQIAQSTGLSAYTMQQFGYRTVWYFIRNTGIPVNFGITVILGCIVGIAICGQTFYLFVLDNLKNLGALKAMGLGNAGLVKMTLAQAALVGVTGYGLGLGGAMLLVVPFKGSELEFDVFWQILALAALMVLVIMVLATGVSLRRVLRLEPAVVFKG
jgi:putative ABC transport system permease protein